MYPKPAKDVSQVRLRIMHWEKKCKAVMFQRGGDGLSALLEMRPKNVKDQMMMRLDEIG